MNAEEDSKMEYGVLTLANNILEALGQTNYLENDDILYSDEFYLTIVNRIVPDNTFDATLGENQEEQSEKLAELINFLASIADVDLSHIDSRKIIYERDESSALTLLELILQLINILKNEDNNNSQLINDDDLRVDSEILDEYNNKSKDKSSALYDNMYSNENRKDGMTSDNEYEKNDNLKQEMDNSNNQDNQSSPLKFVEDQQNDMSEDKEINKSDMLIHEPKSYNNINNTKKEKSRQKEEDDRLSEDKMLSIEENSNLYHKSYNDIYSSSYNSAKSKYSANDISEYIKNVNVLVQSQEILKKEKLSDEQLEQFEKLNDKEKMLIIKEIQKKQFLNECLQQQIEENYINQLNQFQQNMNMDKLHEEAHNVNISRISEVSKSKENSEAPSNNKALNKYASNLSKHNKTDSEKQKIIYNTQNTNNINESNLVDNNAKSLSIPQNNNSYIPSKISSIESKQEIGKKESSIMNNEKNEKIENDNTDKSKNTSGNNKSGQKNEKLTKITPNKVIPKSDKSKTKSNQKGNKNDVKKRPIDKSKSEISMSSVKSLKSKDITNTSNNNQHIINNTNEENCKNVEESTESKLTYPHSDIIFDELPLNDENVKFEIMKEFKRIYGNNLHRLFLKENLSKSSTTLELIIRNLKLAKSKMSKMGSQINKDPDDLLVSFFLILDKRVYVKI